ncbi:acyl-CoA-binding domain-containing protein 4 isoform X2 [Falco biarmicus]|uniref:acyl-CoA-binding domain-containing protein 4 isoform X2 n=1 Tax=Falco peregrinus TaxID=8954 RepID=UPI000FFC1C8D|nr:acyl-CoA-binding domain-containing protein 4 isoform X2 [Falco peregrinus]XP_037267312.1 acyl-CoA-binding domain-containing protein 4 isoform X2 [Falco rusticolus]XP_055553428.1 acyl-CoA-binding domain-containing protein 4 isoform X2 [Falco cherrug]XP_056218168.1 acyl-CoA-binding domain-containing protein 4 isoform X2 [Falco biarmicus]
MEEAGCGAQFRAAVQVIQGLPRSGSYRPSYEEMLRFYSYYKQATAGHCQGPRPGFWDPIGRYKWDAWHSLGRMSKEEAMAAYVAEMKKVAQKIIDTVPMDEMTEEMFRYFEPLYEVIHDMPRPPETFFKKKGGGGLASATEALEGSQVTSDSEGDVYCDTLEQMEPEQAGQPLGLSPNGGQARPEPPGPRSAGQGERQGSRRLEGRSSAGLAAPGSERGLWLTGSGPELTQGLLAELDARVASTVQALQDDMRQVLERLSQLETLTSAQGDAAGTDTGQPLAPQAMSSWPLTVSPRTLLFLITWPFVTQWLLRHWQGRKR